MRGEAKKKSRGGGGGWSRHGLDQSEQRITCQQGRHPWGARRASQGWSACARRVPRLIGGPPSSPQPPTTAAPHVPRSHIPPSLGVLVPLLLILVTTMGPLLTSFSVTLGGVKAALGGVKVVEAALRGAEGGGGRGGMVGERWRAGEEEERVREGEEGERGGRIPRSAAPPSHQLARRPP